MRDARLLGPAVLAWIAAALLVGLDAVPGWVVAVAWVAVVAATAIAIASRSRWVALAAVGLAGVALVTTVVGVRAAERHPAILVEAARSSRHVSAEARTTALASRGDERFAASLTRVVVGDRVARVDVPVLVFVPVDDRIGIGSTVELEGTLAVASGGEDVAYLMFADDVTVSRGPPATLAWSDRLRRSFGATASTLPGDGAALLPGLAIGDTTAVSDDLDAAMKSSSLSHLTAVSGANCAVVVGLAVAACRVLGLRRRWRVAVALVVLAGFVVLVTPQASVLRAAVMATVVLLASLGGRTTRGLPVLATSVLVLLVADPWLGRDYGFALSVLATGALLVLTEPLARVLSRVLPRSAALLIAIPLAAQLACQPVLVLLQPSVPVFGVLANTLAEPAAPVATVLGLAACVASALVPPLGRVLAWIAWAPAAWIAAVARFFAALPAIPWLAGLPGLLLLAALVAAAIVALLASGRARSWAALSCALLLVGIAAASAGSGITQRLSRPGDWEIAACDVGQGDSFVVRSEGRYALIDTGPKPALVRDCLATLGIRRLDLLVLTHYDLDHVGGASALAGRVDRVLVGPPDPVKRLPDLGVPAEQVQRGLVGSLGELRWRVLWPEPGSEPGNQASVTVLFDCASGCATALFLGDLGQEGQDALLAAGELPHVDVVKVAHHGSAEQEPRLYAQVRASLGLIGVGADNDYGHPTKKLLDTLALVGTAVARTDLDGLVLVSPGRDPGTVALWRQREGADGPGPPGDGGGR